MATIGVRTRTVVEQRSRSALHRDHLHPSRSSRDTLTVVSLAAPPAPALSAEGEGQ
jgi:hypothetical protein